MSDQVIYASATVLMDYHRLISLSVMITGPEVLTYISGHLIRAGSRYAEARSHPDPPDFSIRRSP